MVVGYFTVLYLVGFCIESWQNPHIGIHPVDILEGLQAFKCNL